MHAAGVAVVGLRVSQGRLPESAWAARWRPGRELRRPGGGPGRRAVSMTWSAAAFLASGSFAWEVVLALLEYSSAFGDLVDRVRERMPVFSAGVVAVVLGGVDQGGDVVVEQLDGVALQLEVVVV